MSDFDLAHAHVLLALAALLTCAHGVGFLFQQLRLPRVIGEIMGGLLLGPTVAGQLLPDFYRTVFGSNWNANVMLTAIYKLGLILLLFCSGMEIRSSFAAAERRAAAWITATGTVLPFGIALALGPLVDLSSFHGAARSLETFPLAFNLVIAIAIAVTSIPVVSKIFLDLDLVDTPFARIVLSAAVIEDIILYVILAIALSLVAGAPGTREFGLASQLHIEPGSAKALSYHVIVTLVFFGLALGFGRRAFRFFALNKWNVVNRGSPVGYLLTFLMGLTLLALYLGVNIMFGAFVAGMVAAAATTERDEARTAIRQFSSAFFIPVYFAMVGLRLDLVHHLPLAFFLAFTAIACLIKATSVFFGARLAGQSQHGSVNLAMVMNARGGPGIVLASMALDAQIIDDRLYVVLVLVAIVTSLFAGWWLQRALRLGRPLL